MRLFLILAAVVLFVVKLREFQKSRELVSAIQAAFGLALGISLATGNVIVKIVAACLFLVGIGMRLLGWWEIQRKIHGVGLPPLSEEEKRQRALLTFQQRAELQFRESQLKKRFLPDYVDRMKEEAQESIRQDQEEENEDDRKDREEEEMAKKEEAESKSFPIQSAVAVRFSVTAEVSIVDEEGKSHPVAPGDYSGSIGMSVSSESIEEDEAPLLSLRFEFSADSISWQTVVSPYRRPVQWICGATDGTSNIDWTQAPPEWRDSFKTRCFASNILCTDDGRERFPVMIGDRQICLMTKYLSWYCDLAVDESGRKLFLRVRDLRQEKWSGDIFAQSEEDVDHEFEDFELVPAFCCTLPIEEMLPLTALPIEEHEFEDEEETVKVLVYRKVR